MDEIERLTRAKDDASAEFNRVAHLSDFWCPAGDRMEQYWRARDAWQAAVDAWTHATRRAR